MKPVKNTGLALLFMGTGLVGLSLENHSDIHYIGCGTLFGVGANILGSSLAGIFNGKDRGKNLTRFLHR